jgi:hypothetical protein
VQGHRSTRILGVAAPVFIPPMFLVVWILLLIKRFG